MEKIEKFYENTKNAMPHDNVKRIVEIVDKPGNVIDLGCGAGRDTIFLLKNNWKVTAIDKEDTKSIIEKRLTNQEIKNFKFISQSFENIELEKNDLVVSNFSIPFCNKEYFNEFWKKIVDSINRGGYFVGNFFGLKDSWVHIKERMIFLSRKQVEDLFNEFEIIDFQEIEKDGKTGLGKIKHWHTFDVIARKKF